MWALYVCFVVSLDVLFIQNFASKTPYLESVLPCLKGQPLTNDLLASIRNVHTYTMALRLCVLNLLFLTTVIAQYYYVPQVQMPVAPMVRRTFYPVRTNCVNRCGQQRYRWNYRPQGLARPVQPLPIKITFASTTPATPPPPAPLVTPVTSQNASTTTTEAPTSPSSGAPSTELPTPAPYTDDDTERTPNPGVYMRPPKRPYDVIRPPMAQKRVNPCVKGQPLTNNYGTPVTCNYLNKPNAGCPEDYWCHTGVSFATTACCPMMEKEETCQQPRDSGDGDSLVPRWYFDSATKTCKRFLYKGIRGNQNNFISSAQCMEECEAVIATQVNQKVNPCRYGQPARDNRTSRVLTCGTTPESCPSGHYCHIGEDPQNTACCMNSGVENPCLLSINVGQGRALLKRFYYNSIARRCIEFTYKGTRGNENNFLTYDACEKTCMKWESPCPDRAILSERKSCANNGDCSQGEWCHVGSSPDTSVCCRGAVVDTCSQPLDQGYGTENLTRWYVDPTDRSCNRQCKPFFYKGTKGNQNNFLTKEECEQECKPVCINPCGTGNLLTENDGSPRRCGPVSPCPNSHWCHVGGILETTVCCSSVENACDLPMSAGEGEHRLSRWYFSRTDNRCLPFTYRGIGGNQNMFLTVEDCRTVCPSYDNPCSDGEPLLVSGRPKLCNPDSRCPETHFCHIGNEGTSNYCCPKNGDPCLHQVNPGLGTFAITRYFFDKETKRCREFVYQGAKGNANNFLTMEDCELVCPVVPNPCKDGEPLLDRNKEPIICGGEEACPSGFFCHVGAAPETTNCCPGTRKPCDLPLERGVGSHHLERWYFDGTQQICKSFFYRGTRGNSNNFLTKQACREVCQEVNPCGTGEPLIDATGERMLCTGGQRVDSCPKSHYCHVGSSAVTTICCPRSGEEACDLPFKEGRGGEGLPRWFFDPRTNKCQQFTYGGIGGNENNFIAKHTCEQICPEHRSFCPHGLPLIDTLSQKPVECGINKGCPGGFICHMSAEHNVSVCCEDPTDFCLQTRDPGPCTNFETRYGYHPLTDTCVEYDYGGCEGTLNNFRSLERCTEICCKDYKKKRLR
ncbi:hypothetical protein QR680_015397 [Steinernema hermaphroditum]|uniref:BPTI/Kunitz inhibitor domain-containing protein n=1 Tax=Steinernema hermaphroditum TaxID=289476 RepID=A0AA39H7I8_9BILA|nr:hypothetical protein QR680_015397 [Steinernema hermaphroditum]